jgi:hypothetical protein
MLAQLTNIMPKFAMPQELYSLEFVLCSAPLSFSSKFALSIAALKAKMTSLLGEEERRIDEGLTRLDRASDRFMFFQKLQKRGLRTYPGEIKECYDLFQQELTEGNILAEEQHLLELIDGKLFEREAENFETRGIVGELFQNQGLPHFPTYQEDYADELGLSDEVLNFSEFRIWNDENKEKVEALRKAE